jgi:hypothetical protein
MARTPAFLVGPFLLFSLLVASAADEAALKAMLAHKILAPRQTLTEVAKYVEVRLPKIPQVKTVAEWEKYAGKVRAEVLQRTVYRGEAAQWRDARLKVEWQETIKGGPGYRIRKLRFEAVPGLWIPALLYEPEALKAKVPAILNVNGHDRNGKAADYKQIRCINQAKRGMLALNVEWLGMGQLRTKNFEHGRMNQLDLCGTSGLAPFYLSMKRGLDVLLDHKHADPKRVAVTGLSGGGWQTIYISSLDTRVTLTDPVAGYSGYLTRLRHHKDLGDSEQTPCDMATVADYTHLTAMMAPRPSLLTYNSKDDCCFEAGYVLPVLREAAEPIFRLYGKPRNLRTHVNDVPGNHNYGKDNREALYRMLGDFFYPGDKTFDAKEIPSDKEVKNQAELKVELPAHNADFNTLARGLIPKLPRQAKLPAEKKAALAWQETGRKKLRALVHGRVSQLKAVKAGAEEKGGVKAVYWQIKVEGVGTLPVVEFAQAAPKKTAIVVNHEGRIHDAALVEKLLSSGHRVLATDLCYFGEAGISQKDYLFALLVSAVGDRPLGVLATELATLARWSAAEHKGEPVTVMATGSRMSTIALTAAAVETEAIAGLELHGAFGSLKEVIEQNRKVEEMAEQFCFGLLEAFDIKQLTALVAPRPVLFHKPGTRARSELAGLKKWYAMLGKEFEPLR